MDLDVCIPGTPKWFKDGCFVAGTQVVLGVMEEEQEEQAQRASVATVNLTGESGTLLATRRYLTQNIEMLQPGDWILSKNEANFDAPTQMRRIQKVFVRSVNCIETVTLRSSRGVLQTLHTTSEHPVYIDKRGWVKVALIEIGDQFMGPDGSVATVIALKITRYPLGVLVYNIEVAESHTYFVREADSCAEPVWVHNTCGTSGKQLSLFNGHHAFPQYLGGLAKQVLVPIGRVLHEAFHAGLDEFLPRAQGAVAFIRNRGQVLSKLFDYTRDFDRINGTHITQPLIRELHRTGEIQHLIEYMI
jgi:hypothetical protein